MAPRLWIWAVLFGLLTLPAVARQGESSSPVVDLQLNHGKRWAVDPSMMRHLQAMDAALLSFQGRTLGEYHALGQRLDSELDLLMKGCTMSGQAHDELHKWLIPFIEEVRSLRAESDTEMLRKRLGDLRESFHVFNRYFQ